jgi:hypothetical protein
MIFPAGEINYLADAINDAGHILVIVQGGT